MKPRLAIAFALIVVIPLALLSWLGERVVRAERQNVERRFREVYAGKLADIDQSIHRLVEDRERDLLRVVEMRDPDGEKLREETRRNPFIGQMFLLEGDGRIVYPVPGDSLSREESAFLERAKLVLTAHLPALSEGSGFVADQPVRLADSQRVEAAAVAASPVKEESAAAAPAGFVAKSKVLKRGAPPAPAGRSLSTGAGVPAAPRTEGDGGAQAGSSLEVVALSVASPEKKRPAAMDHGWYAWFWGEGLHLIFWRLDERGRIIGAELDRVRFLADVIGLLPETVSTIRYGAPGRLVLSDGLGQTVYQWGAYDPAAGEAAIAERALRYPLSAWVLRQYVPGDALQAFGRGGLLLTLALGIGAALLAFTATVVFFYRESTRELREAAQRVSFVNQVSHELKTPLTNIRMYAELLDDGLAEDDTGARSRLNVIVSESQRLSRLIGNILGFSRRQRGKLAVRLMPVVVDDVIRSVLSHFAPAFSDAGIEIVFDAGAGGRVLADADAVEQILGNLLSNVEKYASGGRWVGVESRGEPGRTVLRVSDRGPGIAAHLAERVFEPFHRGSDRLTEGVSGTGIGLSISRDLARLHGGDVRLIGSGGEGACFEVTLDTPAASEGGTG